MIYRFIQKAARNWVVESNTAAASVLRYIKDAGKLRDAQVSAIETYLFLKMGAGCRSLADIFCSDVSRYFWADLAKEKLSAHMREKMEADASFRTLFEFSRLQDSDGKAVWPQLRSLIERDPDAMKAEEFFRDFFYGVDYADYLFSLPMGAGKTFLMAAFIYLDLYFSELEPDNPVFARNFLVLIPSALKTSIVQSLRSIEEFEPSWVIPEPAATRLKRMLRFEVLDQPKSSRNSNRTKNPNVAKVLEFQPFQDQRGSVIIVNAEQVILDRVSGQLALNPEDSQEESERQANELRAYLGMLPRLQLLIDEAHRSTDARVKLRQVVNFWQSKGNIVSVLGFSGTPYLRQQAQIFCGGDLVLRSKEITNTVFYYPLIQGIARFLKKPVIKISNEKDAQHIIRRGVTDFMEKFGQTIYADGTCAKLAIYCGNIDRLETEIYPLITQKLKIPADQVLKFHRGNKEHKVTPEQEMEFRTLDHPTSKIRIVLLVQIGKEGWDCRSLTGVILSQRGDSPTNMVLQTSCRCLREVTAASQETALVWLNEENAAVLQRQLAEEQRTSIEELNRYEPGKNTDTIQQISRMRHLFLPELDYLQLRIRYDLVEETRDGDIQSSISNVLSDPQLRQAGVITTTGLGPQSDATTDVAVTLPEETIDFYSWFESIARDSSGYVEIDRLMMHADTIRGVFQAITIPNDSGALSFDTSYDLPEIEKRIRLAFRPRRNLTIKEETVPEKATLLYMNRLKRIENHPKIYPNREDAELIQELDAEGADITAIIDEKEELRNRLRSEGKNETQIQRLVPPDPDYSVSVRMKDASFHYMPYDFRKSGFEKALLEQILGMADFRKRKLEIYYNGEPSLTGFRIDCYSKINARWRRAGLYTPDFLILQRKRKAIHKCLILEAKGSGFEDQQRFKARRNFVEEVFLRMNNDAAGYDRFQYLYLSDTDDMSVHIHRLHEVMQRFFGDS